MTLISKKPSEELNKEIIGRIYVRPIDCIMDGKRTLTKANVYDVLDIQNISSDGQKAYIVNEWDDEMEGVVKFIHSSFIKRFIDFRKVGSNENG